MGCCTCCSSPCRCWAGPTARRPACRSSGSASCRCRTSCRSTATWPTRCSSHCTAYAAFTLGGVVLLHVAAAFKHQFIDRDGLLSRMWFTQRQEPTHETCLIDLSGWRRCVLCAASAGAQTPIQLAARAERGGLRDQADGRAGRGQVQEVRRHARSRPEEARVRQHQRADHMLSGLLGVPETDAELPKPIWFDAAKFPEATSSRPPSRAWATASSRSPAS